MIGIRKDNIIPYILGTERWCIYERIVVESGILSIYREIEFNQIRKGGDQHNELWLGFYPLMMMFFISMDHIGGISWWLSVQSLQPDNNNDNNDNVIPFYMIMVSVMDESDYFDDENDEEG